MVRAVDSEIISQIAEKYKERNLTEEWKNEKSTVAEAISVIFRTSKQNEKGEKSDSFVDRYAYMSVLGVGGSGIVLRLRDKKFPELDKALKFPRPVPGKIKLISDLLEKEIKFLAGLNHQGIVTIVDYETLDGVDGYGSLPYFIMNCVDGDVSSKYFKRTGLRSAEFVDICIKTLDVLSYLHRGKDNRSFVHLDVKPENVVITKSGSPVFIDMGTCKSRDYANDPTLIACTKSYAHPELARLLTEDPTDENRARAEIERSKIEPSWDLWAFALTVLEWLGIPHETGKERDKCAITTMDAYTRKYLLLFVARILGQDADKIPSWLIEKVGLSARFLEGIALRSTEDALRVLLHLNDDVSVLDKVDEITSSARGTIQAAPGSHVPITEALMMTLDHALFRRLNSISQLGLVSQVYKGANHTRQGHSLGTYANAIKFVKALYNDRDSPLFRQLVTEGDLRDLLLAALLHDIGQFPLAHDLEDIDKTIFSHTELTNSMIKGTWSIKKAGAKSIKFESMKEIFDVWKTTPQRITDLLQAKATNVDASPKHKLLRSIISGPIDADKLDYLFRDAIRLDLPYPQGVDTDRLLRCLTTVVVEKVDGGARDVPVIGVHAKGKVAAEFLSFARYAMFSQGYWHHAVRVQKAMLARSVYALLFNKKDTEIRRFKSEFVEMVRDLPASMYAVSDSQQSLLTEKNSSLQYENASGAGLAPTDAAVLSWFASRLDGANRPEKILIGDILHRRLYKRLWVISREMEKNVWDDIVLKWDRLDRDQKHSLGHQFEQKIFEKTAGKLKTVTEMKSRDAEAELDSYQTAKIPWLLVDIPGRRPGSDLGLYYVLESQRRRLRKDSKAVGTAMLSKVWEQYAKELLDVAGKIRIYCHPKIVESLDASLEWESGIKSLQDVIEELSK